MNQDQPDPYNPLRQVLDEAFEQASGGKGKERHAQGRPFLRQPILEIGRMVGPGFEVGQAMKKGQEALGFISSGAEDAERRACVELLGAINYLAAAVILIRERQSSSIAPTPEQIETFRRMPGGAIERTYHAMSVDEVGRALRNAGLDVDEGTEAKQDKPKLSPSIDPPLTMQDITVTGGPTKVFVSQSDEHWMLYDYNKDSERFHGKQIVEGKSRYASWRRDGRVALQEGIETVRDLVARLQPQDSPTPLGSKRANIGHPGELSSRLLCEKDLGKTVIRRDGTAAKIQDLYATGFLIRRLDDVGYCVNKAGFLTSADTPNAADIRQVILG